MELHPVLSDQNTLVQAAAPATDAEGAVLISCTGVGHAMGAINVQKLEFVGAGRTFENTLFLTDLKRAWGNNLEADTLKAALAPYLRNKRIVTLGNSMGGFLAVLLSRIFEVDVAIALAPQFSVHPDIVPSEKRWQEYRQAIGAFKYPSLETAFNDTCSYYLFSGDTPKE